MSIDQLKKHISISDLEFEYNGKWYYICPLNNVFSAGEADTDPTDYKTFDELINNFLVQGKQLKEILPDIDW